MTSPARELLRKEVIGASTKLVVFLVFLGVTIGVIDHLLSTQELPLKAK